MVKLGYKQTEIGVIPEDWEISKLGNIGQFKNGINKDKDKFGYGVPIIGLMDVFGVNHINSTANIGLVDASPYEQEDYSLKEGDVLFVRSSVKPAGVGLTAVVEQTLQNAVFSGFLLRYRTEKLTVGFKRYAFYASYFRENLIAASTVSANTNINQDSLKQLVLAYPTDEAEQNKIAQAISHIDALILNLEEQLSKKKAIKQGAMQELLTGEKRLPGFSGVWKYMELGKYGSLIKESINPQVFPSENFWEYSMPAFDEGRTPVKQRGLDMHSNRIAIYGKVLLFNKLNVRQKRIWMVHQCRDRAVCSSEFLPYQSDKINLELLAQILNTDKVTLEFIGMSTGTSNSQKRITPNNFLEYKVYLPTDKNEQAAIAEIFACLDDEIIALEQKLTKYRQIKQGMMQQLLTGKIRLV